jgi:hypothetical protein
VNACQEFLGKISGKPIVTVRNLIRVFQPANGWDGIGGLKVLEEDGSTHSREGQGC